MSLIRTKQAECPHCGADGTKLDGRWNSMGFRVRCQCSASTSANSRQEAIDKWNKRSEMAAIEYLIKTINEEQIDCEAILSSIKRGVRGYGG